MAHIHLATHFNHVRNIRRLEGERNIFDRTYIGCDVFSNTSVTAGCRLNKLAFFITQRSRETVNFWLRRDRQLFLTQPEKAANTLTEINHILVGKSVPK